VDECQTGLRGRGSIRPSAGASTMRSHNDGNKRPRGNEAAHGPVAEADVTDVTLV